MSKKRCQRPWKAVLRPVLSWLDDFPVLDLIRPEIPLFQSLNDGLLSGLLVFSMEVRQRILYALNEQIRSLQCRFVQIRQAQDP